MSGSMRQANFLLPAGLLDELRRAVPRGQQSRVVGEALRNELQRLRFRQAVTESSGAWKDRAHPELPWARGASCDRCGDPPGGPGGGRERG